MFIYTLILLIASCNIIIDAGILPENNNEPGCLNKTCEECIKGGGGEIFCPNLNGAKCCSAAHECTDFKNNVIGCGVTETNTTSSASISVTTTTTTPSTTSSTTTTPTTTSQPTTTVSDTTVTTRTTPATTGRHFDAPSFIGGIVLALGLLAIIYVSFKFYKARTERNYHTL
ncbi:sialomucin core protein 24-like [Argiope bruennichi]|uniref:Sialomucin core protein 24 n=1 Tax=Argiope bruennichi TaxID=94029 RepID=A0A8T0FJ10_ARGBR|nr:sialomucin core protein 24-like [Argiope bruennichi]KAF8790991.1 hypothetical protein HNY73_005929 [Argiope bruennichi]